MTHAAIFDVDGTLVDTNHLHVTAWWEAFRQAGHRVAMHDIHRAVGLGGGDLIAALLGEQRRREEDDSISAAHTTLYATYFDRLPAFDGAARLLRELSGRGWHVVLATSATGAELGALRRALDADDVVRATASADDTAEGKPAPDPVKHAMGLVGGTAETSVFVGDTVWDMRAAARAGVTTVGVLSGGIPREDLVESGAAGVYSDVADLLNRLGRSPFALPDVG
ncbi:HAD family hydrolase [Streptomyces sp. NPDC060198]|uniref:HAD family hydrolase n=1 Tax=Streptomyces sp. NPDC060198 TaxID=3347070 RepID=UPI0036693962